MKYLLLFLFSFPFILFAQQNDRNSGILSGNILDAVNSAALEGCTVKLINLNTSDSTSGLSDAEGSFLFDPVPYGYYRLSIKAIGYTSVIIDSIFIREERWDFNLSDIKLSVSASELISVIIYSEKPLYENKDGKITFNAAESALSNSSSATELLKQTPLVDVDQDGKVLLKGKEVKILIDDKPMDMDARQLQELLESMPGSMIEKIEVLTTPPPQYANERGGVINIVTKKGKAGFNGRFNINYGTRGQAGINANGSYRKNGLSLNLTSGWSWNEYNSYNYSIRNNIYKDSSNFFNTSGNSNSNSKRPVLRLTVDFTINKKSSLSIAAAYNVSVSNSGSATEYRNINRFDTLYRLSERNILSNSESKSPSFNLSYTLKTKDPRELLRFIAAYNIHNSETDRNFYQEFLDPYSENIISDSSQRQNTLIKNRTMSFRLNYDRPINKKISFNTGGTYSFFSSRNILATAFMKKPENIFVNNLLLSNDFIFRQNVSGLRAALRYEIKKDFTAEAGILMEYTQTDFDLKIISGDYSNTYYSTLPFFTVRNKWVSGFNFLAGYKRTIQRPGINQLNPSIDYGDPYNTRFGNPFLKPYFADNFDISAGYWNKKFNLNLSAGYNILSDIYSSIRTLQADGKTTITWENISGRTEYDAHFWGGLTISKKFKINLSAGYSYNIYSLHDRTRNRFRNGGSLNSSLNGNYIFSKTLNGTAAFTFNKYANPQGSVRNTLSMNLGLQKKMFKNKVNASINITDPFRQQQNYNFIYGPSYNLETFRETISTNLRIAVAYNFKKTPKPKKKVIKSK